MVEVKTEVRKGCALEAPQAFAKKNRGALGVASLKMHMRHGHLDQTLEDASLRVCRFMPEIFKDVMSGIPLL